MGYRDMNPLCIVSRPDLNRTTYRNSQTASS